MFLLICELTLKQTQREKGRVARTMAQEMAVRIHPQRPIPSSVSSAETNIYTTNGNTVTGYDIMGDQTPNIVSPSLARLVTSF